MQNDSRKSKSQLIEELRDLRHRANAPDEASPAGHELSQFKMALRCSRAGCYDIDIPSLTAIWSPELEEIYGMEPGSFSGSFEEWEACVLPEDLEGAVSCIRRLIDTDGGIAPPFRIRRRDTGEIRWLEARGRVVRDEEGRPARLVGINMDITDRVQAEEERRFSFERLHLAQRAAGAGLWDWDITTKTLTWTPEFYALFGVDPATVASFEVWLTAVHPEDREAAMQNIRESVDRRTPLEQEYRLLLPDGGVRWVSAKGDTFYDEQKQPVRMCGICIDITAHKEHEAANERMRVLYAALSHVNQIVAQRAARDQMFDEVCSAFVTFGDFPLARIARFAPDAPAPGCIVQCGGPPGGSEVPEAGCSENCLTECSVGMAVREARSHVCNDTAAGGHSMPCCKNLVRGGWRSVAALPIRESGRVCGALILGSRTAGFFGDAEMLLLEEASTSISLALDHLHAEMLRRHAEEALHLSEQNHRLIILNSPDLTIVQAVDGTVLYVSPQVEATLGYPQEEFIGRALPERIHPDDREEAHAAMLRAMDGEAIVDFQYRFLGPDGNIRWLSHTARPVYVNGVRTSVQSCVRNITVSKEAERRRETTIELLRHCNQAESVRDLIQRLTAYLQKFSGCEAVGVRLRSGSDFPYYETLGFEQEFVRQESPLCAVGSDGRTLLDHDGNSIMECMCGNVLCSRFDPSQSFFTSRGSFWTNSTTESRACASVEYPLGRVRNRCNAEGYESVALIPICSQGRILGLVQFNDRVPGRFSQKEIELLEDLIDYAAIALSRQQSDEAFRQSEQRLTQALSGADLGMWDWNVVTGQLHINARWAQMLGYTENEIALHVDQWAELLHPDDEPRVREVLYAHLVGETDSYSTEHRLRHKSGAWVWVLDKGRVTERDADGHPLRACGTHLDITDRKHAEAALRENEETFRVVFENSPVALETFDKQGILTRCNRRVNELFGVNTQTLAGKFDLHDDPNYQYPDVWERLHRGETVAHEIVFDFGRVPYPTSKTGTVNLYISATPIDDSVSPSIGYILQIVDITEMKRAQEALRESEERFKALFAYSNDAAFVSRLRPDATIGNFVDVNETACTRLGYSRKELLARSAFGITAPEMKERIAGILELLVRERSAVFETIHVSKDGRRVPTEVSSRLVQYKGEDHLFSIARDLTERKKAEQQLALDAAIFSNIAEGVVLVSTDSRIIRFTNRRFEWMFGYQPGELIGKNISVLSHPSVKNPAETLDIVHESLKTRGEWHGELERVRKDGARIWVSVSASLFVHPEFGEVFLGVHTDVTDVRIAEHELSHFHDLMRYVIEHSRSGVAVHDRDMRYVYVSQRYLDDYHLAGCDIIGKHHYDVFPDLPQKWRDAHQRVLRGEVLSAEDDPYVRADGTVEWTRWECRPWYEADGSIGGLIVYTEMTTERKRMQDALRASEERYRRILVSAMDGFWTLDAEGWILEVNDAYCRMSGYTREELLRMRASELDIVEDPSEVIAHIRRIDAEGGDRFKTKHRTKDGRIYEVEISSRVMPDSGGRAEAFLRDISAERKAERELLHSRDLLRYVIEHDPSAIAVLDKDLRYVYVSERWLRDYGNQERDVIGKRHYDVMPELSIERRQVHQRVLAGEVLRADDDPFPRRNGTLDWVRWECRPWYEADGSVAGIILYTEVITERKKAELALRESEERLRLALDAANAGTWEWDLDTNAEVWSDETWRLTGLERHGGAPSHEAWLGSIAPEDRPAIESEVRACIASLQDINIEWRVNGAERWLMSRGRPIRTGNGPVRAYRGIVIDITERRRVEGALRESQATLEAAMASMTDAVFICDTEGRLIHFNSAVYSFLRLRGSTDAIASRADLSVHYDVLMANGEPAPIDMWPISRALRGEIGTGVEYPARRKDTGETWVGSHSFGPIRDKDGRIVGAVSVAHDITERKRIEEALREKNEQLDLTLQSTGVGIWHWNIIERKMSADRQTLLILGIDEEQFMGAAEDFFSVVHADDRQAVREALLQTIEQGTLYEAEYRVVWQDGSEHFVAARGKVVHTEGGRPVRIAGTVWDVSAHKLLELQLQQSQKMEAIGQLAGGVAHDFNNLLQVISANAELAHADLAAGSEIAEQVEEIRKAAGRAADLTRQLLAFSRRQIMRPADIDVNALIHGVLKMLRRVIGEHIELCFLPGSRLGTVSADKGQLEQVIMNLCVNARDAMLRGGRLTIETQDAMLDAEFCRLHLWAKEGRYALLSVADTGIGIDAATRDHIFEPFFTTKDIGQGTGLGLATVYGIVKQHSGLICVESEPASGSTFKIYLPVVERPAEPAAASESVPLGSGTETILVAEDDETILRILTFLLKGSGYTVITARNGREALQVFEENAEKIDLVMLDVMMPELGGREVMDQILAWGFKAPFLFSSGYSEDSIHTDFVIHEGLHLIQKPYSKNELLTEVRKLLDTEQR